MRSYSMMMAAVFGVCVLSASCSTTEPAPPARTAAQPIAAQPPRGNSNTAAAARSGAATVSPETDRELRSEGYTPEARRGGVTVYCRGEAPIGTRFEKKTCSSAEDLMAAQQAASDFVKHSGAASK